MYQIQLDPDPGPGYIKTFRVVVAGTGACETKQSLAEMHLREGVHLRLLIPKLVVRRVLACLLLPAAIVLPVHRAVADLIVGPSGTAPVINFDNTVSGVNFGQWAAGGFAPATGTSGRLDSNSWAVTGWSTGDLAFGGIQVTPLTPYRTGIVLPVGGSTTTSGMHAYTVTTGDRALWFQPNAGDFEPGTITLRVKNETGSAQSLWDVSYLLFNNNDGSRSSTFDFSFSTDNSSYSSVGALSFTSPESPDALGVLTFPKSTQITAPVANNGNLFLRWSSNLFSGSAAAGGRDEFGLDNITISAAAVPEPGAWMLLLVVSGVAGVRFALSRGTA